MQKFSIGAISLPDDTAPLFIAGPCVIENRAMAIEVAEELQRISREHGVRFIFKGSYRKANRTSGSSFTGIGDLEALEVLAEIRKIYDMPVITDVHEIKDVALAARYVDVLQIPAFLCRQTDLIVAAAKAVKHSGGWLHVKKGQFLAPMDCANILLKARQAIGEDRVILCERGVSFGYNNLVVDMLGFAQMKALGCPVTIDATHAVQLPELR